MTDLEIFIEATNKYYNGENTGMSDKEYDQLENKLKSEIPNFNKFDYVTIYQSQRVPHYESFQPHDYKIAFESIDQLHELLNKINEKHYLTYKYDGSSIRVYYRNGEISDIITRSDEYSGIRQLQKLINKVPNKVDQSVKFIDFEAVTSKEDFGEDSRSKSNGLVNSKYKQDEVDQYLVLIPFKVTSTKTSDYLESMKLVFNDDEFIICDQNKLTYEERFIEFNGKTYPIDGFVVYYSNKLNHGIFKFYAGEDVVTEVTDIHWTLQGNGSYTPKIKFNPIKISGRNISQATSNGYARLSSIKAGIGAKITVILANSTIPQVHEVKVPSENYNIPENCPYCSSNMEIVNNKVRCTNPRCTKIYEWIASAYLRSIIIDNSNYVEKLNTINSKDSLIKIVDELKNNNNLNLDHSIIGNSLMNSISVERFSNAKKNLAIEYINNNIDNIINDSIKKSNISNYFSWNQWNVVTGYLDILDDIIQVIYKE